MSVLIWAQTVCKGYPRTAKVAASEERVNNKINLSIITSIYHSLSLFDRKNIEFNTLPEHVLIKIIVQLHVSLAGFCLWNYIVSYRPQQEPDCCLQMTKE